MPQIQSHSVHVSKLLSNVGVRYMNASYIADLVAPIVDVVNDTDYYASWPRDVMFRNEAPHRAEGAAAAQISLQVTLTNTYQCEEYSLRTPITERVRRNADSELQLQTRLTELLVDRLAGAREARVAAFINTSGSWDNSTTLAGGDQWSNAAQSDPVGDLDTAIATVNDAAPGAMANVAVFGEVSWRTFRRHPSIIALVFGGGFQGSLIVTPELVARAFELDKVLVGKAMQIVPTTTVGTERPIATEITTPGTLTKVWGDYCWVGHVNPAPSIMTPTAIHQFRQFAYTRAWFNDETKSDWIEVTESMDEKVIAKPCGYLISDTVA